MNHIHPALLLALLLVAGCSKPDAVADPFAATGELIALSGGEAGAAYACASCHGLKGEGDGNLSPRLAGIDEGYLSRQLGFYAEGQRSHAEMAAIAKRLSMEQRQKVSAYYAAMDGPRACADPFPPIALYHAGDPRRGIASCASCHGATGEGNTGNPPLAGQSSDYLAKQLRDWREGNRYGDANGTMTRISKAITPSEARALAAYASRLPGGFRNPQSREACPPARRADPRNGA